MKRTLFGHVPPRSATALVVLVLWGAACRPELEDDASRVDGPRILAVRAEPAEARPSETVTLTALFTDGSRGVADGALGWRFCTARRALAEAGPIDPACLAGSAAVLIGAGAQVPAVVPRDACRLFGPDRPLSKPGEPAGRPADPDGTGGFFQPGLVDGAGAAPTLFEVRVRCTLPSVAQAVSLDFERRYRPNTNPRIARVSRIRSSGAVEDLDESLELRAGRGETVRLRVAWDDCAGEDPCEGAERYISYDGEARTIVDRREALTVSWLSSAGRFPAPRTGRDESDVTTMTENDWSAPGAPGEGVVFIVLRDARGGAAFRTLSVRIE